MIKKQLIGSKIVIAVSLFFCTQTVASEEGQKKTGDLCVIQNQKKRRAILDAEEEDDVEFQNICKTELSQLNLKQAQIILNKLKNLPENFLSKQEQRMLAFLTEVCSQKNDTEAFALSDEELEMLEFLFDKLLLFKKRQAMLKALANEFPIPAEVVGFTLGEAQRILVGTEDEKIKEAVKYSGTTFNTSYGSECLFDTVSRRIIYILTRQFFLLKNQQKTTPQYMLRLLAWLGMARAVIDCSSKNVTETDFGFCIPVRKRPFKLSEPWSLSIPKPYRIFTLMRFRNLNETEAVSKASQDVEHRPAGDLSFLQPLIDSLQTSSDSFELLVCKFIFHFAKSSTFKRGQASIMEWIYTALASVNQVRIVLKTENPSSQLLLKAIESFQKDGIFETIKRNYSSFKESSLSQWTDTYTRVVQDLKRCSEAFGGAYNDFLEREFSSFLLETACFMLSHLEISKNFSSRCFVDAWDKKNFLSRRYGPLSKFFIEKCAKPIKDYVEKLPAGTFSFNDFRNKSLESLNNFLEGVPSLMWEEKITILNTWGNVFFQAVQFLLQHGTLSAGDYRSFDVDFYLERLFDNMRKDFLKRLFSHLDVIALDIDDFGSFLRFVSSLICVTPFPRNDQDEEEQTQKESTKTYQEPKILINKPYDHLEDIVKDFSPWQDDIGYEFKGTVLRIYKNPNDNKFLVRIPPEEGIICVRCSLWENSKVLPLMFAI